MAKSSQIEQKDNTNSQKRLDDEKIKLEKEREKQQEERKKRALARQKREMKRIKMLVELPLKMILNISIVSSLVAFVVSYFLLNNDPVSTIVKSFLVFCVLYFVVGLIIIGIFIIMSYQKEKQEKEAKEQEKNRQIELEKQRHFEEMKELESIEKEIAANSMNVERSKKYMVTYGNGKNKITQENKTQDTSTNSMNLNEEMVQNLSDENDYLNEIMK
jgi:hypothetical protein